MIRIILTLCLFFIGANAYSQAPLIIRNDGKSTALDSNLFVGKSFRPPAFNDTTQANQSIKVLDSSGRIIFTRDSSTLWVRNIGKYWQKLVSGSGVITLQQAFNAAPTANPDINAGNNTFLIAGDNDLGGISRLIVGNNQGAQLYSKLDNIGYVNAKADGTVEISSSFAGSNSQKLVMNESKSYLVSGGSSGSDTSLTKLGIGTLYPEAPLDVSGAPRFRTDSAQAGYVWTAKNTNGQGEWRVVSTADSSTYFTNYRADTMRNNIYSAIGNVPTPTLQQVLDNNHDLTNGNNFQGTGAGVGTGTTQSVNAFGTNAGANMGIIDPVTDVNAMGSESATNNEGSQVNAFGNSAAVNNQGSNVNALGFSAGYDNTFNYVNLLGANTTATNNNQTVFGRASGSGMVRLDYNNISQDRQYDFPDSSGTIALLSNIQDSTTYFTNYRADTMRSNLYANKVPYTGATQDVDLGAFKLNAQSVHIKGTAGAGHLGLKHQSAAATASGNETSLYANSNGDIAWKNDNLYITTLKTSGNTADRIYTFPDSTGTVALLSNVNVKQDTATAWKTGGNFNVNAGQFIGSNNNASLRFRTNGIQRMVLDSLGNISYNGNLSPLNTSGMYSVGLSSSVSNGKITAYTNEGLSPLQSFEFGFYNTSLNSNGGFSDTTNNNFAFRLYGNNIASGLGGGTMTSIKIDPTLNFVGNSNAGIFRGIHYSPTLTNLTNTTHIAYENASGNVLMGTSSGQVGIGTNTSLAPSSILDITSSNRGVLFPRMSSSTRNSITSPDQGLMIWNTTDTTLNQYTGNQWRSIASLNNPTFTGTVTIPTLQVTNRTSLEGVNIDKDSLPITTTNRWALTVDTTNNLVQRFDLRRKADTTGATFTGAVGIGAAPVSTAQLDVSSTTSGILIPRMTTTQRNAISTPATGLMIYNTTDSSHYTYDGVRWNRQLSANGLQTITGTPQTGSSANGILDLSQTWNTTGAPTAIRLNVTNTASNINSNLINFIVGGNSMFRVRFDGALTTPETIRANLFATTTSTTSSSFSHFFSSRTITATSGLSNIFTISNQFSPASGTATFTGFDLSSTINQTGGANGITRGLHINPTLTSAADWRAIETTNGQLRMSDTYAAGSGSLAGSLLNLSQTWNTTGNPAAIRLNVTNTASGSTASLMDLQVGGTSYFTVDKGAKITQFATNTAAGTTGNQTINRPTGTVNIAAAGTNVTVTNNLVTANSLVFAVIRTNDTTAVIKNVVPGAGTFTINLNAAATAETSIGFWVIN